jgi:hypothetical protein
MDVSAIALCNTYFKTMPRSDHSPWLLLLYSLPTKRNTERVAVWRRLKKMGAAQFTTSTYLLPDRPTQHEQFQWLAQQIRDSGGEATLVIVQEIEGLTPEKVVSLFNGARDREYIALKKDLQSFLTKKKKTSAPDTATELERMTRQFRELREIDFFESPRGHEVAMLLSHAAGGSKQKLPQLSAKDYHRKRWQTRPRPEIDRVGSAWLIRKFIDPEAKFVFASEPPSRRDVIPFDMVDVEFSHQGEDCTFETLLRRFDISDKAARRIGEMIHDADLDDGKFQQVECIGIDRVLKGWNKSAMTDQEVLSAGCACFDGLYEFLQRR